MSSRLPHTRRARLVLAGAVAALLAVVAIASAALGGGATPPKRSLAVAVHNALTAPAVPGVTADIKFSNNLVSSGALPRGAQASPLLSGATGRAWVAKDGRFRLELQSSDGDDQVVSDGRTLTLYDGKRNTVYTAKLPADRERGSRAKHAHGTPTLADVKRGLAKLARHATVSGAIPTNVAGKPAYEVKLSPKHDGGLLAALTAAWDAGNGVPLRLALTAQGSSKPVLELEATDISYGTVPASDLQAPSPPGAKHVRIDLPTKARRAERPTHGRGADARHREVTGLAAVGKATGLAVKAPAQLVGLKRQGVRLVGDPSKARKRGALVLYGHGLGGLAVLQTPAAASGQADRQLRQLQSVSIGGATGRELPTALGTLLRWTSGGVTYTLAGSLPSAAAETAARDLARR